MDEIKKGALEIGGSVTGALVGLAIGGPVGAIAGAAVTPIISMTHNIVSKAKARRIARANEIVERSFKAANISPEEAINILNDNDSKADEYIRLLRTVMESDQELDIILSNLLSHVLTSDNTIEEERLLILADSIRNMRSVHIKIIKSLYESQDNRQTAPQIALKLQIPEIELRNTVRDLELRGIIKDLDKSPTLWQLRELGISLAQLLENKHN